MRVRERRESIRVGDQTKAEVSTLIDAPLPPAKAGFYRRTESVDVAVRVIIMCASWSK